jgi:4-hydroxybenzoate polyprenyltransferase
MASFDILWRLLRVPNLIIVALAQCLVWFAIIRPGFETYHLQTYLDIPHFLLLVLCTVIITAGGNAVNDLYDVEIDRINKPKSQIVGRLISIEDTYRIYIILILLGALIAGYLAWYLGRLSLFMFYPIACFLLWSYSRWFKRLPVSGNVIVSIFVACVPLVLLIPEWKNIINTPFLNSLEHKLVWSFAGFAFATNLLREFVKDIEDVKGDKEIGANTLAVILGPERGRNWALAFAFLLLGGFVVWFLVIIDKVNLFNLIYFSVALVGSLLLIIILLWRAKTRIHFKQISLWIKILIVLGLFYILLFI